ncbi:hypothetical protein ACIRO3_23500 [Streptomyces sp. NPDC102278]|uniref:hypothetical protein n=1 Tax=Streptomyces sp. NPDC102278 TaxID=3366152 RepID=UPI003803BD2D
MSPAPRACRTAFGLRRPGGGRRRGGRGRSGDLGERAVCRTADPDELFVDGAAQNRAKVLCTGRPLATSWRCLLEAARSEHDRLAVADKEQAWDVAG